MMLRKRVVLALLSFSCCLGVPAMAGTVEMQLGTAQMLHPNPASPGGGPILIGAAGASIVDLTVPTAVGRVDAGVHMMQGGFFSKAHARFFWTKRAVFHPSTAGELPPSGYGVYTVEIWTTGQVNANGMSPSSTCSAMAYTSEWSNQIFVSAGIPTSLAYPMSSRITYMSNPWVAIGDGKYACEIGLHMQLQVEAERQGYMGQANGYAVIGIRVVDFIP
jgi:hypothetical protein